MQQIKIFQAAEEVEINQWLRENPKIKILYVNRIPMHDRYSYGQGDICNQWIDTVIIYQEGQN
jgi:hypothetical protein